MKPPIKSYNLIYFTHQSVQYWPQNSPFTAQNFNLFFLSLRYQKPGTFCVPLLNARSKLRPKVSQVRKRNKKISRLLNAKGNARSKLRPKVSQVRKRNKKKFRLSSKAREFFFSAGNARSKLRPKVSQVRKRNKKNSRLINALIFPPSAREVKAKGQLGQVEEQKNLSLYYMWQWHWVKSFTLGCPCSLRSQPIVLRFNR